tara:strand:+ start:444 stop:662 length:219 start_codon:yes stop_codon:yes gene_type:complete
MNANSRKPEIGAALVALRALGGDPWAPEVLAEDARRLARFRVDRLGVPWDEARAWLEGWGSSDAGPPPVRRL